ncbi:MAG: FTR1 family iron permease [Acidimicrobiales bacterium]
MIPTFVIFFREGIEASMIVAILLSYLNRLGQRRHFRDVLWGVAAALVLVLVGGVSAFELVRHYEGSNVQTYFETATFLVAATALTYMTFWMQRHARSIGEELERRSDLALSTGARAGLGLLAFQAVGREGLETMVFTLAIVFASSKQAGTPIHGNLLLLGAGLGLALALCVAFAIYRMGAKLNLRRFFQVLGVLLMIFAAGLLADAVENLQQLNWLPFGREVLWNSTGLVSEASNTGDVLHSLVGYADRPTLLQVALWTAYVALSTTIFIGRGRQRRRQQRLRVMSSGSDAAIGSPKESTTSTAHP